MGGVGVLSKMYISVTNSNTAIVVMCSSVPWLQLLCALFFCVFLLEYKRTKSSSQTLCRCSCVVCSASGQMYLPFLTAGCGHSRLPWKKWSYPFFSLFFFGPPFSAHLISCSSTLDVMLSSFGWFCPLVSFVGLVFSFVSRLQCLGAFGMLLCTQACKHTVLKTSECSHLFSNLFCFFSPIYN